VSPLPLGEGAVEEEKKTVVSSSRNLKRRKKVNALAKTSLTDPIEILFTNKLIHKKGRRPALNKQFITIHTFSFCVFKMFGGVFRNIFSIFSKYV
jgi:hypothetical protein